MKILLLLTILSTSLAFGRGSPPPKPAPEAQKPGEIVVESPGPIKSPGKTAIVLNASGTPAQIARLTRIVPVVEKVINSPEFKSRVLGAYYNGKLQFVDTKLSNAQVFDVIMASDWTLEIRLEKLGRNVLGRTFTNVKWFSFNSRNFDSRKDSGLAGTICHEQLHKLGFKHSKYNNSARPYSVPYAVGTICAELYSSFE